MRKFTGANMAMIILYCFTARVSKGLPGNAGLIEIRIDRKTG